MRASDFVEKIQKNFSPDSVRVLNNGSLKCERISTQCLALDSILGGGLPLGRIVEIFGNEGSGKTTLCLHILAEAQRRGGISVFIDLENAFLPAYAEAVGISLEDLIFSQPASGDEALSLIKTVLKEKEPDEMGVIVVDSATALTPLEELEGEISDAKYAPVARLLSQGLRRITPLMQRGKVLLVFTNQMREKVGVVFGKTEESTGGRALKFYSSVRMEVTRKKNLADSAGKQYGQLSQVTVLKNKTAMPFQRCEIPIVWGSGIDLKRSIFNFALERGIISKSGAFFSYDGGKKFHGENKFIELFDGFDDLEGELKKMF